MLNLTQHTPTVDQQVAGVVDPIAHKAEIKQLLTFDDIADTEAMKERADGLVAIAKLYDATSVMIGGAPYFMGPLAAALHAAGIIPYHAFTKRDVEEIPTAEGTKKVVVFKHQGFIKA